MAKLRTRTVVIADTTYLVVSPFYLFDQKMRVFYNMADDHDNAKEMVALLESHPNVIIEVRNKYGRVGYFVVRKDEVFRRGPDVYKPQMAYTKRFIVRLQAFEDMTAAVERIDKLNLLLN